MKPGKSPLSSRNGLASNGGDVKDAEVASVASEQLYPLILRSREAAARRMWPERRPHGFETALTRLLTMRI
jgi:hypothetical protein